MPLADEYGVRFKYRVGQLKEREVEVITYMSLADDEFNVIINGVMMYPPGTRMPWKHGGYNISMVVVKSVSRNFAYGKQPLASAKTLQALSDETIRNLVRKMRQAIEPPLGVSGGKVYSKDIWSPGAVTQGLGKDAFSKLVDHQGVTTSEFQMFQLIEQKIDEFIGYKALEVGSRATATQVVALQKENLKSLGLVMLAVVRMKREMAYLRLGTVFEHYLRPVGKTVDPITEEIRNKFRSFTVTNSDLGKGLDGTKMLSLTDRATTPQELQSMFETEKAAASVGKNLRFSIIDVNRLAKVPFSLFVTVNPVDKDSNALDKSMFQERVSQIGEIQQLTQRPVNASKLIEDFERTWKVRGLFEQSPAGQPPQGQPPAPGGGGSQGPGANLGPTFQPRSGGQTARPSINTLSDAAQ
jgi:hypothetical protein